MKKIIVLLTCVSRIAMCGVFNWQVVDESPYIFVGNVEDRKLHRMTTDVFSSFIGLVESTGKSMALELLCDDGTWLFIKPNGSETKFSWIDMEKIFSY